MKSEKTEKSIISLQLPNFIIDKLKEQAEKECTSVSYLIRKLIIQSVNEGDKEHVR